MGGRYDGEPRDSCPTIDAAIDQFAEIRGCLQKAENSLESTRDINETLRMDNRQFEKDIEEKDIKIEELEDEVRSRDERIAELETELQHMREFVHGRAA